MLLSVVTDAAPTAIVAQQADLAVALRNDTPAKRGEAITRILEIAPGARGEAITAAIISELRRQATIRDDRMRRYNAGEKLAPVDEDDYTGRLLQAASQSHDARFIAPMCLFIGNGTMVENAVARFGEQAVRPVLEIARLDALSESTSGAISTLAKMLSTDGQNRLSAASRIDIRDVAIRRLTEKSAHPTVGVVSAVAEIALAFGDPTLVERVRLLQRDASAVRAIGFTDPFMIGLVQRLLAGLLAKKVEGGADLLKADGQGLQSATRCLAA
jgi:hypothetical protein